MCECGAHARLVCAMVVRADDAMKGTGGVLKVLGCKGMKNIGVTWVIRVVMGIRVDMNRSGTSSGTPARPATFINTYT